MIRWWWPVTLCHWRNVCWRVTKTEMMIMTNVAMCEGNDDANANIVILMMMTLPAWWQYWYRKPMTWPTNVDNGKWCGGEMTNSDDDIEMTSFCRINTTFYYCHYFHYWRKVVLLLSNGNETIFQLFYSIGSNMMKMIQLTLLMIGIWWWWYLLLMILFWCVDDDQCNWWYWRHDQFMYDDGVYWYSRLLYYSLWPWWYVLMTTMMKEGPQWYWYYPKIN